MTRRVASRGVPGGGVGYLLAIGLGALAMVAGGIALAGSVWLLPTLFAVLLEREPGRPMARAMALFGVAASLSGLLALWAAGGGVTVGLNAALDPASAVRSWSAQGTAWLLGELSPILLVLQAEATSGRQLRRLRAARRELEDEWSESEL